MAFPIIAITVGACRVNADTLDEGEQLYTGETMKTLKEVMDRRRELASLDAEHRKAWAEWCTQLKAETQELMLFESLLAGGVDLERLNHGEHVIDIYGDYRKVGGESASCIEEAKADLAAGCPKMKREYFGAKNYDRWSGQRSDHTYGYGPKHGNVVFSIGLTQAARQMELTSQMIEDALYVLANIDKVLDARQKAKAAA